jgi:hypothetical protein
VTQRPVSQSDRHDAPRLVDELVLGVAAMIDDRVVGSEHRVGQPVVVHKLPDVLDRVQLRALGGQRNDGDVRRHGQAFGHVPPGLINQQRAVLVWRDLGGDLGQVQFHRLDVAPRQHQTGSGPRLRPDRPENVDGRRALVLWCRWARAAPSPTPGDLVLLPDTSLVCEPYLYVSGDRVNRSLRILGAAWLREPAAILI